MEELIVGIAEGLPLVLLFVIIFIVLYLLGKGADLLVDEAVTLSVKWGIPKYSSERQSSAWEQHSLKPQFPFLRRFRAT